MFEYDEANGGYVVTGVSDVYSYDGSNPLTIIIPSIYNDGNNGIAGVIGIKAYAFGDCEGLYSVTMSDSITYIGDYAFQGCFNLCSITLSKIWRILLLMHLIVVSI